MDAGPHRPHHEDLPGRGTGGAERVSDRAVAAAEPASGWQGVKIGMSDTGLQPNLDRCYPWMTNVTGDHRTTRADACPMASRASHSTPATGPSRPVSPSAWRPKPRCTSTITSPSRGEAEDVIIQKLEELITGSVNRTWSAFLPVPTPAKTRGPLPFNRFHQRHPDITLVAAAGNDSMDRKFYPAAFPWASGSAP